MSESRKNAKPYKILAGHQKIGSKFTQFPDMLTETSYVRETLPELLWIALLNDSLGEQTTAEVVATISKALPEQERSNWFVFCSQLAKLSATSSSAVRKGLSESSLLNKIQNSLAPFVFLYPSFPVTCFDIEPTHEADYLPRFKKVLGLLLDKTSRPATIMLATAIYGLGISGGLELPQDSVMADLNAVIDYPDTDKSQMVASGLRALMITLVRYAGPEDAEARDGPTAWSDQFWQRGLQLEPVDYELLLRGARNAENLG